MSSEKQNKSIHWFAMNAVQDRVTGNALDNLRPIKSIIKMENKEFLPFFMISFLCLPEYLWTKYLLCKLSNLWL